MTRAAPEPVRDEEMLVLDNMGRDPALSPTVDLLDILRPRQACRSQFGSH